MPRERPTIRIFRRTFIHRLARAVVFSCLTSESTDASRRVPRWSRNLGVVPEESGKSEQSLCMGAGCWLFGLRFSRAATPEAGAPVPPPRLPPALIGRRPRSFLSPADPRQEQEH